MYSIFKGALCLSKREEILENWWSTKFTAPSNSESIFRLLLGVQNNVTGGLVPF